MYEGENTPLISLLISTIPVFIPLSPTLLSSARTAKHRELKKFRSTQASSPEGFVRGVRWSRSRSKKGNAAAGDRSFVRYGLPAINACHCRR